MPTKSRQGTAKLPCGTAINIAVVSQTGTKVVVTTIIKVVLTWHDLLRNVASCGPRVGVDYLANLR